MEIYGISQTDIIEIDRKIDFQKEYLRKYKSNCFLTPENDDFLSSVYSANLNPKKYFAEINNRVNSLVANAKDLGLKPVFITITAPAKYHKKDEYGNYYISPNTTAKSLTSIWNNFTNLQIFQKSRDTYKITYFRVYEPHKSGVPHLHCMLFLPVSAILDVKKKFYEYFTNKSTWGANIGGIGFRYTWFKEKGGAVGYVMKYILKSFKNEDDTKIQYSVYWYVKHRIRRFLTSRTLCNLSLYRKVRYYFKYKFGNDLKEIKRLIDCGFIYYSFDKTIINYRHFDDDGLLQDDIIWAKNTEFVLNSRKIVDNRIHLKYVKFVPVSSKFLNVFLDGVHTWNINKETFKITKFRPILSKLSDFQLVNYKNRLNTEKEDINHLYVLDKEIQKRYF